VFGSILDRIDFEKINLCLKTNNNVELIKQTECLDNFDQNFFWIYNY